MPVPALDPADATRFLEASTDPCLVVDGDGRIRWTNRAIDRIGWDADTLANRLVFEVIDAADLDRALRTLGAVRSGHRPPSSAPFGILTPTGESVECDVAGWVLGEEPLRIGVHLRPTHDARILRLLLERLLAGDPSPELLGHLLELLYHRSDAVRLAVAFVDEHGTHQLIGDLSDPVLAGEHAESSAPWRAARAAGEVTLHVGMEGLPAAVAERATAAGLRDCLIVPVRADDLGHLATITAWVTETGPPAHLDSYSVPLVRQLVELVLRWRIQTRELEHAAARDPLTALPNRRAVHEFDPGPGPELGALFIDLDHFKPVNDRLGHAAGDRVLQVVAARLAAEVEPGDLVARIGGDEFGIVCPYGDEDRLATMAGRVLRSLADPIDVDGAVVRIGGSIGAARGPGPAIELLERADRALYQAKEAGRGTVRWAR